MNNIDMITTIAWIILISTVSATKQKKLSCHIKPAFHQDSVIGRAFFEIDQIYFIKQKNWRRPKPPTARRVGALRERPHRPLVRCDETLTDGRERGQGRRAGELLCWSFYIYTYKRISTGTVCVDHLPPSPT